MHRRGCSPRTCPLRDGPHGARPASRVRRDPGNRSSAGTRARDAAAWSRLGPPRGCRTQAPGEAHAQVPHRLLGTVLALPVGTDDEAGFETPPAPKAAPEVYADEGLRALLEPCGLP